MNANDKAKASEALWFGLFPADSKTLSFLQEAASLDEPVDYPHITFGYKVSPPDELDWDGIYDVVVNGYGNDGINEGYRVELPIELDDFYFGAETPHITLSTSIDGSPVNTAFIDFEPVEPFIIPMKFGFYYRGKYFV